MMERLKQPYVQTMKMSKDEIILARALWSTRHFDPDISVRGLAAQFGVSKTTMHKILSGQRG